MISFNFRTTYFQKKIQSTIIIINGYFVKDGLIINNSDVATNLYYDLDKFLSKVDGDFNSRIIMDTYNYMVENVYPNNRVILAGFNSNSYYAGPREAILTALCRKNFGCSHFIVGRDHTGVSDFYEPYSSHEIFDKFSDLGIEPVKCKEILFSHKRGYFFEDDKKYNLLDDNTIDISGSKIRKMIKEKIEPEDYIMRSEIFELIKQEINKGNKIFVE